MDNKYPIQINLYSSHICGVCRIHFHTQNGQLRDCFILSYQKQTWKWFFGLEHSKQKVYLLAVISPIHNIDNLRKVGLRFTHIKDCQELSRIVNPEECSPLEFHNPVLDCCNHNRRVYLLVCCKDYISEIANQKRLSWCSQVFSNKNALCYMHCSPSWPYWSYSTPVLILCNKDWRPD